MEWNHIPFEKAIEKVTYTAKIPKKKFLVSGNYPIISQESEFINGYWDNQDDVFVVASPVVIFGDHTKVVKHIDFNFVLGADGVKILKPIDEINSRFLAYFLESAPVADLGYARHYRLLKEISVPTPELSEQKRIVAILDQVFADIEQARAKTEQNLKNARELFESKKVNLFEKLSITANLMPLPSVCNSIFAGGDAPKKGLYSKEKTETFNIPIYANAVKQNGLYGYTDYSRANEPSITIAARGSGTGHIELRKEPFLPIVRLIVLTPNKEIVHLDFLKHALQILDILRSGSAIPQLTVPMIKEYSIPVPSLNVQKTTVDELELLKKSIGRVEKIYQEKTVLLDELKKSILQKAFSGELTKTQDGDTNRGAVA